MRRLSVLALLVLGCGGSDGPELLAGFTPPPPPSNGFQIVLPIVHGLQPGTDNEYCTWTDRIVDHDIDVKGVSGLQSKAGHHIIMFSTKQQRPANTTEKCTSADMETFRFGAAAVGEGQTGLNLAPGNVVYRIPAGSQIVVNHHYINASSAPLDAQSVLNVILADPGAQSIPAGALTFLDTNMRVPVGGGSLDVSCTMSQDQKVWRFFPHMHEYGTHTFIEHTTSDGHAERLFDVDWTPEYTFHPPEIVRDPADPLLFKAGDRILVHCEWNNTTANPLSFGLEMCVAFGQTIDGADLDCDHGQWGTF